MTELDQTHASTLLFMLQANAIFNVNVEVADGHCTLEGQCATEEERDKAIQTVESYEGIAGLSVDIDLDDEEDDDEFDVLLETPDDEPDPVTYTVKKGDSYWGIAKRTLGSGRKWKLLKQANGNKKVIHPGDVLLIPDLNSNVA